MASYDVVSTVTPRLLHSLTDAVMYRDNNTSPLPAVDKCAQGTTKGSNVAFSVYFVCVIAISVLGNALVCIAITTSRRLRSRKTNYFIVSLAISDMFFSLTFTASMASFYINNAAFCHPLDVCKTYIILDGTATTASISSLFVIAVDRYLAVAMPYKYATMVSGRRALGVVALVWMYGVLWGSLSSFSWDNPAVSGITINPVTRMCQNDNKTFYVTSLSLVYLIPLGIMAALYSRILKIAFYHARAIRATEVDVPVVNLPLNSHRRTSNRQTRSRRKLELKATKTLAIVYGAFVACWLPLWVVQLISLSNPLLFAKLARDNPTALKFIYHCFLQILPTLSAVVNPFIYTFSSKHFRDGFKQLMMRAVRRHLPVARSNRTTATPGGVVAEGETCFVELEPHH